MPAVIVQHIKFRVCGDPDRVKMTGDRLFPMDLAIQVSSFDGAFTYAIFPHDICTLLIVIYTWSRIISLKIFNPGTGTLYRLDTNICHIWFDMWIDILQNLQFRHLQRSSGVTLHATSAFTLIQIANEILT